MKQNINILFLITLLITLSIAHIQEIVLDEDNNFILSWDYNSENITFELEGDFKGWLAFGFACQNCPEGSMEMMMGHPDMVSVSFDQNGIPTLRDMIEKMDMTPMQQYDVDIGGQENILRYGGYQSEHHSLVYYTRKLKTGDTIGDYDIDVTKTFTVSWYIGKDNIIDFDSPLELGSVSFNLESGETVEGGGDGHNHSHGSFADFGPLYAWHAALMGIAFGFLIPLGVFCMRYLKDYQWSFYLHIVIQSTALAFIIVGFSLIIYVHDNKLGRSPHSILGVILAALVFAVGVGGLVSFLWKSSDDNQSSSPVFPHKIHGWAGKLVVLLSIATIITGLNQYLVSVAFIIVYSILVLTYIIIVIFIEVYKKLYGSTPGEVKMNKI